MPSFLGIPFINSSKSHTSAVIDIINVNKPPRPNDKNGIGKNIIHGFPGENPHHFRIYPMIDRNVDTINAFLLPNLLDIHVIIGITKNAVATALIVENHAGQLPACSIFPLYK